MRYSGEDPTLRYCSDQTLRCAKFVFLNLWCPVKRNYLRCCCTSSITTVHMWTMYGQWLCDVFALRKIAKVMALIVLQSIINIKCGRFPFSFPKSDIDHVNHGTLKIYCGVGVVKFSCGDAVSVFYLRCCGIQSPPIPPSQCKSASLSSAEAHQVVRGSLLYE